MITITRLLAKQVASVFSRALSLSRNLALDQPVSLTAGPDGLFIRSATAQYAVEYREPTAVAPFELIVPLELFRTAAGAKPEPVTITCAGDGAIVVRWQDAAIPKAVQWAPPSPKGIQTFPPAPVTFAGNPPALRTALRDAFDTTDAYSTYYSLGCVQLQGQQGVIAATDGRQILLQTGFQFPFAADILVERTAMFGSLGLPLEIPLLVGATDEHLAVRMGLWTLYLPIRKEGRFPRLDEHMPACEPASSLDLHPADRQFLADNLPKLPANPGDYGVTLDLNGSIAVRARSQADLSPTELVLSNSRRNGADVTVAIDRRFLARAIDMGFARLAVFGDRPLLGCRDERRTYLWGPLAPESIVKPQTDAVCIPSPPSESLPSPVGKTRGRHPHPPSPPTSMSETTSQSLPPAAVPDPAQRRRSGVQSAQPNPVDQAVNLRSAFRGLVTQTNELIRSLKQQKRQQRLMQMTLQSLKQLQNS